MQIRPLTEAEMTSASQLVRQVLGEHVEATYPEEAKSAFYAFYRAGKSEPDACGK